FCVSTCRSNLLKNPRAEDGLQGWEIVKNGGDGWLTENRGHPDDTVTKCFLTSFRLCLKQQLIDLKERGYSDAFMDLLQPPIRISDWYSPRYDCGSEYQICVELLDQRKNPIRTFQPGRVSFQQWNKEPWCQVSRVTHAVKFFFCSQTYSQRVVVPVCVLLYSR
ncbi:hypothetical protein PO909_016581, partial [Leuciscus waleckii]